MGTMGPIRSNRPVATSLEVISMQVTSPAISVDPYRFNMMLPVGAASKNVRTNSMGRASPDNVHVFKWGRALPKSGRMCNMARNNEGTAINRVTRARRSSSIRASGSTRMACGTTSKGTPQHNAPKISKMESTKFNDVFEHTNSAPLKGYSDHIH